MLCLFSILLSAIPPPKKTMNLQGEPLNYYEHNFNWNIVFLKDAAHLSETDYFAMRQETDS